jgi:hypothetical protein
MSTNNHKEEGEYSVGVPFCIAIVLLMTSGSTVTTVVYASHQINNGSESSGSGPSDIINGTGSDASGNSGNTEGGSKGSQETDNSTSSADNGGGSTGGDNTTNLRPSSNQAGTPHCDRSGRSSCSSSVIESGKTAGSSTNNKNNIQHNGSSSNSNFALLSEEAEASHCDKAGWPSCFTVGFQDGENHAGATCPAGHSTNFCSGWNAGARSYIKPSSCRIISKSHCSTTTRITGLGTILEVAPDVPAGSHTLEYIEAFNTASANPYKPGTKHYQDYQTGLEDAKKAGRDCDKMDTCGGPDLLGKYIKGVLHLNDKQYCGNGFGVYSTKVCKFREGCTADIWGTVTCQPSQLPARVK